MTDDPFAPDDLAPEERNAQALARSDLRMLTALVQLRHDLGLTQEDVAKAIGRDKSAVSRFERLDSDPRLSTIRRYARALGALIEHRVTAFDVDESTMAEEASNRTATAEWVPLKNFIEGSTKVNAVYYLAGWPLPRTQGAARIAITTMADISDSWVVWTKPARAEEQNDDEVLYHLEKSWSIS